MSAEYANVLDECKLDFSDKMDNDQRKSSRRRSGSHTAALWIFLGVLIFILLFVILILVIHNFMAISSWNSHQQSPDVKDNLPSMVMELKERLNNETQKKIEKTTKGVCSSLGWIEVNRECYYISPKGVSLTWEKSKQNCEARGGRLVTIKNWPKLHLLGLFHDRTWIGLSDRETEGKWVWEDGTALVGSHLWVEGEPNDAGEREDCVQLTVTAEIVGFNDNDCGGTLPYICETLA